MEGHSFHLPATRDGEEKKSHSVLYLLLETLNFELDIYYARFFLTV